MCIAGLCQLTETHRCSIDDDCSDIVQPWSATRAPRCGSLFAAEARLCDAIDVVSSCISSLPPTCFATTCVYGDYQCAPVGADLDDWSHRCEQRLADGYKISLCLPVDADAGAP